MTRRFLCCIIKTELWQQYYIISSVRRSATGKEIHKVNDKVEVILKEVGKVIRGKEKEIELVMTAILAKGHILIEDVPGVGKRHWPLPFPVRWN